MQTSAAETAQTTAKTNWTGAPIFVALRRSVPIGINFRLGRLCARPPM